MKSGLFQDDLEHFSARRCSHRWKSSESDSFLPSFLPAHLFFALLHPDSEWFFASFLPSWFVSQVSAIVVCLALPHLKFFYHHAFPSLKSSINFMPACFVLPYLIQRVRGIFIKSFWSLCFSLHYFIQKARVIFLQFSCRNALPLLALSRKWEWFFKTFLFLPPCLSLPYFFQKEFAHLLEEALSIKSSGHFYHLHFYRTRVRSLAMLVTNWLPP